MRHSVPFAGLLAFVLLLAFPWNPAGAQEQKGTLVVVLETLGGQTMDPIQEGRAGHAHYQAPVYDALLGFDIEKGGVGPGVAERWEIAKDGLSWTFYLRKGHKWHNGDPVTAHDVKFSLERTMSKDSIASRASALRRGSLIDRIAGTIAVLGIATPNFWLGILLIYVFSVQLGWLPSARMGGISRYVLPTSLWGRS